MAVLSVQKIVPAGLEPAYASAAAEGDSFFFSGHEHLEVVNGGESDITVTIPAQQACGTFGVTNSAHDLTITVTAGETRKIKIPAIGYTDANGRVQVEYSDVTSVTVGVFVN